MGYPHFMKPLFNDVFPPPRDQKYLPAIKIVFSPEGKVIVRWPGGWRYINLPWATPSGPWMDTNSSCRSTIWVSAWTSNPPTQTLLVYLVSLHWGSWVILRGQVTPKTGWNSLRSNMLTSPTAPQNFTYHLPQPRRGLNTLIPGSCWPPKWCPWWRSQTTHACAWLDLWLDPQLKMATGEGWIGRWLVKGSIYSWF